MRNISSHVSSKNFHSHALYAILKNSKEQETVFLEFASVRFVFTQKLLRLRMGSKAGACSRHVLRGTICQQLCMAHYSYKDVALSPPLRCKMRNLDFWNSK